MAVDTPHYHPSTEQYSWSDQEVNSSGYHSKGGPTSFSGRGCHDVQQSYARIDNRLGTLEERTSEIQGTLRDHTEWQATMGNEVAQIHQQQNLQLQHIDMMFQHFGIRPPH